MLSATSFASVAPSLIQLPAAEQCLVADQSCSQIKALVAGAQLPVLVGEQNGDPLKGISEDLRQQREAGQPIRTLHLIAHGRPGAFRIGNVWIDAEALKAHANELAHWGVEAIALWSCHVGADADFVALLAELSGAQVLASADWLGRDGDGNERLQLGAWSLADVTDASAWPASFRLASVPYDEISTGALSQRLSSQPDDLLLLDVKPLASSAADAIDGTDADFPAIYANLFGECTFDPSKGGWDYYYFTSYALPDFVG